MQRVESVKITGADFTGDGSTAIYTIEYDDAVTAPGAVATAVTDRVGYPARALDE